MPQWVEKITAKCGEIEKWRGNAENSWNGFIMIYAKYAKNKETRNVFYFIVPIYRLIQHILDA